MSIDHILTRAIACARKRLQGDLSQRQSRAAVHRELFDEFPDGPCDSRYDYAERLAEFEAENEVWTPEGEEALIRAEFIAAHRKQLRDLLGPYAVPEERFVLPTPKPPAHSSRAGVPEDDASQRAGNKEETGADIPPDTAPVSPTSCENCGQQIAWDRVKHSWLHVAAMQLWGIACYPHAIRPGIAPKYVATPTTSTDATTPLSHVAPEEGGIPADLTTVGGDTTPGQQLRDVGGGVSPLIRGVLESHRFFDDRFGRYCGCTRDFRRDDYLDEWSEHVARIVLDATATALDALT